jgi:hypothetical protein
MKHIGCFHIELLFQNATIPTHNKFLPHSNLLWQSRMENLQCKKIHEHTF